MDRKGIVHGMEISEYHGGPEVSCSSLKTACRSLAHYKAYMEHGSDISAKVSLDGNLIHCAILEPLEFNHRYIVSPKFDMRTTVGKVGEAAFAEAAGTREPITQDQYAMAKTAAANVAKCEPLHFIMQGGKPEVSIFWNDSESGLDCRCRPDWLSGDTIVDVKSTDDCRTFQKSVLNYGYHMQAAFYTDGCREAGINIKRFLFLVVEKKAPFDFMLYELSDELLQVGSAQVRKALNDISMAHFTGVWPGYGDEIKIVEKPSWM